VKPLVIGYGNQLRGDDAVGRHAAELLKDERWGVITCHQLAPELAEDLAASSVAVFLDAHAELAPGEVSVQEAGFGEGEPVSFLHTFDAVGLLQLTRQLYGRVPKAWLVGIGGESFELSDTLSPAAQEGARTAAEAVKKLLAG
jgi:hydrogenase maturation protease